MPYKTQHTDNVVLSVENSKYKTTKTELQDPFFKGFTRA
jgi:hypothetical protein